MIYIADLHVHSRHSRATAKNLDLERLYISARRKGITLVATGDFTHPLWFAELREKLVPAEPGLFALKEEIRRGCEGDIPASCPGTVRFILETEISNIYKKDGKTRKNHNLVYVPGFEAAERLIARLDAVGNIRSDGRPILGLDARNLLEILLECSAEGFLIPAHIWTPWFSLLGSKSGFDSLAACFGDLSDHIFAVETGLSSDPPMNWRVSELDRRTLVSNSDAHSPSNLGRNANLLNTDLSFFALREAIASGDPARCLGTIDMYPEEGKYHMDGHRKCNVWRHPSEGAVTGYRCPECGEPMTIGVLNRVEALADRPEGTTFPDRPPCHHLIPLAEILSEISGVGENSRRVARDLDQTIHRLGPELLILKDCPIERIREAGIPLLGEAIHRMRLGRVRVFPGFDGEYGRIRLFGEGEKERLKGQQSIFCPGRTKRPTAEKRPLPIPRDPGEESGSGGPPAGADAPAPEAPPEEGLFTLKGLNEAQAAAVRHEGGPLLIVAGPGTGKTRTLTHRIAHLMAVRGVPAGNILAVTFTNKAAREMQTRLAALFSSLPEPPGEFPAIGTFHGFCAALLREVENAPRAVIDEDDRALLIQAAFDRDPRPLPPGSLPVRRVSEWISRAKQSLVGPEGPPGEVGDAFAAPNFRRVYRAYQEMLRAEGLMDYDDLLMETVLRLEEDPAFRGRLADRCRHLLVDEYQDVNPAQYRLIRALCPDDGRELFVIGDPDQSIYGFRGADVGFFRRFAEDFPGARTIHLSRNYRSVEAILEAAHHMIRRHSLNSPEVRAYSEIDGCRTLTVLEAATEKSEAVAVGKRIESMVGGFGFSSIDFGGSDGGLGKADRAFSDFAVLYRSHAQGGIFLETLQRAGIPCQMAHREKLYGQPGVRELMSLYRLLSGRGILNDLENLCRLPGLGWSRERIRSFREWFYRKGTPLKDLLREEDPGSDLPPGARDPFRSLRKMLRELRGRILGMPPEEALILLKEEPLLKERIEACPERVEACQALVRRAAGISPGAAADFFDTAALDADVDVHDGAAQKVTLATFHAAKGLEFPVVFIVGCEDGFLPFRNRENRCENEDEERRLFYVGMTRAMDALFLSCAKTRFIHGKPEKRRLSPFVSDIARHLIERRKTGGPPPPRPRVQLDLFPGE